MLFLMKNEINTNRDDLTGVTTRTKNTAHNTSFGPTHMDGSAFVLADIRGR